MGVIFLALLLALARSPYYKTSPFGAPCKAAISAFFIYVLGALQGDQIGGFGLFLALEVVLEIALEIMLLK